MHAVVISGEAVLRRLSAGPRAAEVMPLLSTLPFDQTESAENGGFFQGAQQRFLSDYDGHLHKWTAACSTHGVPSLMLAL